MGRKQKSPTVVGRRIPLELVIEARAIQARFNKVGKRISLQDAMRYVARSCRKLKW